MATFTETLTDVLHTKDAATEQIPGTREHPTELPYRADDPAKPMPPNQLSRWTAVEANMVLTALAERVLFRGTWDSTWNYRINDVVIRGAFSFIAIAESVNQPPPGLAWELFAFVGEADEVILTAPNDSKWRLTVDNTGNLTTTAI